MKKFLSFVLVVIGLALSVPSFGQDLSRVSMDFVQGSRGCPHTYRITVEFVGGDDGLTVVSRGTIDPPATAGFPGGSRQTVLVNLSPRLNPRKVKNVRIRIEGDRPGQDITSPWDLREIRVTNLDNRRSLWVGRDLGWVFDARNTTRTSSDWPTYDRGGRNTKTNRWSLVVLTGDDDLRDDSSASALLVFRDGAAIPIDIGRSRGLGSRNASILSINMGNLEQSLSDLMAVYLFKSSYYKFTGLGGRFRALGSRDLNSDDWDIRAVEVRLQLGDRDMIGQDLPRLAGKFGSGVKVQEIANNFIPMGLRGNLSAQMARLVVFVKGDYDVWNPDQLPEIVASVRYEGASEFRRVGGRTTETVGYMGESPIRNGFAWTGPTGRNSPNMMSERSSSIHEGTQCFYVDFPLWSSATPRPVQEVKLEVTNKEGTTALVSAPYTGGRSVTIRGYYLGLAANYGIPAPVGYVTNHVTLGMDLSQLQTLDRNRREIRFRLNHSLPPTR